MQPGPLQSRLAASLSASLTKFALFLLLSSPRLASATESPIDNVVRLAERLEGSGPLDITYEPDFAAFDRSIIGRAPSGVTALLDNDHPGSNINPGNIMCYMMEKKTIFGRDAVTVRSPSDTDSHDDNEDDEKSKTGNTRTVYISANTCLQPSLQKKDALAPQLKLYVSTSGNVFCPTTAAELSKMKQVEFSQGAAMYSVNATGDVYFGIVAPNITGNYTDTYNYEIAASLDDFYHRYDPENSTELLWIDSDSNSVLLVSRNLTDSTGESQTILKEPLPYDIFIQNNNSDSIIGLQHSYCGLKKRAELWGTSSGLGSGLISMGFTTRGPGGFVKQQFYLEGLNASSLYSGILVKTRSTENSTSSKSQRAINVGGGGVVFKATNFTTSGGTNCKVITNLEFCNEIQWAVPGNDKNFNNTALAKKYDDYAKAMYANFEKALMQIPCEVSSTSRYSLAKSCNDCKEAYKQWLCTVALPRCEDVASNSTIGIYRNVNQAFPNGTRLPEAQRKELGQTPAYNASRNSWIDTMIMPGPYKELLPCDDVCYAVVQSCPAAIGFTCPQPNNPSFNYSYARRNKNPGGEVTCNFPGETRTQISLATTVLLPTPLILSVLPLVMWLSF
ncbi:stretch-activated Ca2+-permeable channel component-domain-containing protein [Mariannaea sp. PMI_226]|nr:stretch-activated Ca2+-permeable channel component-domain-containing protein [Mariannaea sp. PMI_226]